VEGAIMLGVAKEVKNRYPECVIIFGGAQPPIRL